MSDVVQSTEDHVKDPEGVYFVSQYSPSFKVRIGRKRITFVNGVFRTDDEKLEQTFKEMLDPESKHFNPSLFREVRVLDVEAASKVAKANRRKDIASRAAAAGGMTSAHKNQALANALKEREASLVGQGMTVEKAQELMEKEHLALTATAKGVSTPSEGFIPDPKTEKKSVFEGTTQAQDEAKIAETGPHASQKSALSEMLKKKDK